MIATTMVSLIWSFIMLRDEPMWIGASSIQITTQSMTFFLAQVLPVHQGSCSRAGRRSDHEGVAKRVTRFQVMPPIISRSQPPAPTRRLPA
jgi:hypothetical protein